jgi:ubiquinone/menaquinone biosynthesis C-methylase UbiE
MTDHDTARRRWDRRAPRYDVGPGSERLAIGDSRSWLCSRAVGRTLEVAVGTGRNVPLYRPEVELTAIDLSPGMLAQARRRAERLGRQIQLDEGVAEKLPYADAEFDTVVCTLAICAVRDRAVAIAEMYRVLRPGGRLLLLDHLEPRWVRGRPVTLAIRQGFVVERHERLRLGLIERLDARRPPLPEAATGNSDQT